jgi:nucleotide-binding universal stress UspA family protein
MYERILVPLDGSELAEVAIPFAELIPSRHVRLLQVEPIVITTQSAAMEQPEHAHEERAARAREYLARLAMGLHRQGRDVELVVEIGDPRERIIAAAADADLIVIGTRGRSVGGRAFGASVADHVVRTARVPTLLVRGALSQAAPSLARIVVPLDGSALAEAALPAAARMSGLLGVRIHLIRVIPKSTAAAVMGPGQREAAAYLDAQAMQLASADHFATKEVLVGPIGAMLLEAILPTDLVVMTAHGAGRQRRAPLGSVAERLVAEAVGPVMLLHQGID